MPPAHARQAGGVASDTAPSFDGSSDGEHATADLGRSPELRPKRALRWKRRISWSVVRGSYQTVSAGRRAR